MQALSGIIELADIQPFGKHASMTRLQVERRIEKYGSYGSRRSLNVPIPICFRHLLQTSENLLWAVFHLAEELVHRRNFRGFRIWTTNIWRMI